MDKDRALPAQVGLDLQAHDFVEAPGGQGRLLHLPETGYQGPPGYLKEIIVAHNGSESLDVV